LSTEMPLEILCEMLLVTALESVLALAKYLSMEQQRPLFLVRQWRHGGEAFS
jgi:hypothetical protein